MIIAISIDIANAIDIQLPRATRHRAVTSVAPIYETGAPNPPKPKCWGVLEASGDGIGVSWGRSWGYIGSKLPTSSWGLLDLFWLQSMTCAIFGHLEWPNNISLIAEISWGSMSMLVVELVGRLLVHFIAGCLAARLVGRCIGWQANV